MSSAVEELRSVYRELEPPGVDTWNPVTRGDLELWHRVRLLVEATRAVRAIGQDPGKMRVLDVGCGVGRSSRLLVELGFLPESIVAIDLREDPILLAKRLNPAIRHVAIKSLADWPPEPFNLCIQCTAFGSLPGISTREETAGLMERSVGPAGYIYWWDGLRANGFAGGDALNPFGLFSGRSVVFARDLSLYPSLEEAADSLPRGARFARKFLRLLPSKKTHQSILFGPRIQTSP